MYKLATSPLFSLIILVLGTQFYQTFITVALEQAKFTETAIGIVHSACYFGFLISSIHGEKIIRRIGHIRAFTMCSCLITTAIIIQAFKINFYSWVIARFFSGIALAALYITIESWLLAESSVKDRGRKLAIYMISLYSAQAMSSQIFHLVNTTTLEPYLVVALLCSLANIPVSLTYKTNPEMPEMAKLKIIEVYKVSPYGFAGCFVSGLILSALYSFLPKYALQYNLSIAWMMSTLICGGFLLQWPLGKLSDYLNRDKVLVSLSTIVILPAILLMLLNNHYYRYILAFLLGGFSFVLYPISISLVCDLIKNKCIVQVTGVLLFAYSLGAVFGPILASACIDLFNSSLALFAYIALVASLYSAIGIYRWLKYKLHFPIDESNSMSCIPLPTETQVASQLDPRVTLPDTEENLQQAISKENIIQTDLH